MPPPGGRGTRSGSTLEAAIKAALQNNGFGVEEQKFIGIRPDGGRHKVDLAVTRPNKTKFLISLKWQQVPGTAEEKVFFEVIKMLHAIRESGGLYDKAYIVLGGGGFSEGMLNFYASEQYRTYIVDCEKIDVLIMDEAIKRANQALL
jgi:hypothetical protein